jgi:predicted pyridoxine 5'-phosphate oxidase superfamily flavin-nucleotide-binding protein
MQPHIYSSDIAFTPSVKAQQIAKGSRQAYEAMELNGSWQTRISPELADFVAAQTSVFLATSNAEGQPYIQHRGGPKGFLHVLDDKTIAFADFAGNRQYVTLGNIANNPKAFLFLIDYEHRRRVKIWGELKAVEDQPELAEGLMPPAYRARAERVFLFTVEAFDVNCPQHIPQRFEAADVIALIEARDKRISELEDELASLRAAAPPRSA